MIHEMDPLSFFPRRGSSLIENNNLDCRALGAGHRTCAAMTFVPANKVIAHAGGETWVSYLVAFQNGLSYPLRFRFRGYYARKRKMLWRGTLRVNRLFCRHTMIVLSMQGECFIHKSEGFSTLALLISDYLSGG